MPWIDRPKHGWEGLYDSDEKIYSGKHEPRKELSEEEQIRLERPICSIEWCCGYIEQGEWRSGWYLYSR